VSFLDFCLEFGQISWLLALRLAPIAALNTSRAARQGSHEVALLLDLWRLDVV